jgi:hypothetical protein
MFQQIYNHIEMPHDEQLDLKKKGKKIIFYLILSNLLSLVTARLRTRSDLFPTKIIGTLRFIDISVSANSFSRIFFIN